MHKIAFYRVTVFIAALAVAAAAASCGDVEVKDKQGSKADTNGAGDSVVATDVGPDGTGGDDTSGADAAGVDAGGDAGSTVPMPPSLCNPCSASQECLAVSGKKSKCSDLDGRGYFCGAGCASDSDCRADFFCREVTTVEGDTAKQCVPRAGEGEPAAAVGECFCSAEAKDKTLATTCYNALQSGGKVTAKCTGTRSCGDKGLSDCDAKVPTKEVCDDLDNDCSGTADDTACDDGEPCTTDACTKAQTCSNTATKGACDDGDKCTIGDTCATGTCKGVPNACDDGDPCTKDSCSSASGCAHVKIDGCSVCAADKDCADTDGCTVDRCVIATGKCVHGAKKCDDGDTCTDDICDKATGSCTSKAKASCAGVQQMPFSANFDCGSAANKLWTLDKAVGGGPAWGFDDTPTPPGAKSPKCSLNFNNGTDFSCPSGASGVSGTALSPWIDATKVHPKANLRVKMQVGGTWESNNND